MLSNTYRVKYQVLKHRSNIISSFERWLVSGKSVGPEEKREAHQSFQQADDSPAGKTPEKRERLSGLTLHGKSGKMVLSLDSNQPGNLSGGTMYRLDHWQKRLTAFVDYQASQSAMSLSFVLMGCA